MDQCTRHPGGGKLQADLREVAAIPGCQLTVHAAAAGPVCRTDGHDRPPHLSPHERRWREGLAAATRYYAVYGDLACTNAYVHPDGFRLGMWLANKRRRSDWLSPEQRKALDDLNM
ncbi:helicase associated domain-containing protein [Streptomyces albogriseolus]|uniref:helicase associated domain-containing protein n=1 Tax=Streptomyces albogriseolus TaxID=1887 RepID=UPI0036FA1771